MAGRFTPPLRLGHQDDLINICPGMSEMCPASARDDQRHVGLTDPEAFGKFLLGPAARRIQFADRHYVGLRNLGLTMLAAPGLALPLDHVSNIVGTRPAVQVRRSDARGVVATVSDDQPVGGLAGSQFPRIDVRVTIDPS